MFNLLTYSIVMFGPNTANNASSVSKNPIQSPNVPMVNAYECYINMR